MKIKKNKIKINGKLLLLKAYYRAKPESNPLIACG